MSDMHKFRSTLKVCDRIDMMTYKFPESLNSETNWFDRWDEKR
jgi:hypothetical protein